MVSQVTGINSVFGQFSIPERKDGYCYTAPTQEQRAVEEKHHGKNVVIAALAVGLTTLAATLVLKRVGKLEFKEALKNAGGSIPNNLINYRDTFVKRPMYKFAPTRKIHKGITDLWLSIGRNTVQSSHLKTIKKFNKLVASIKGDDAQRILGTMHKDVLSNLSGTPLKTRLDTMYSSLDPLEKFFLETPFRTLFDKKAMIDSLTKFRANERIAVPRQQAADAVKPLQDTCAELIKQLKELNPQDVKKLEAFGKSFEKSLKLETGSYFDMIRDLRVGSAPTDITSVLATTGGAVVALSACEDKETRTSATLKYGIPVIGAVAMQPLTTAMLIAGMKSAVVGIITGFIFNRIGEQVDNARKKYTHDIIKT